MSHALSVVVSGVVALVPRKGKRGYRVILPDTLPVRPPRTALDGEELRDHFPHLRMGRQAWFLEAGHQLHFGLGTTPLPFSESLDHALRMEYAMDATRCRIHSGHLAATPGPGAAVVLDVTQGDLTARDTASWTIDGRPLGGPVGTYDIAHEIRWSIAGLTADVSVSAVPFGARRARSHEITVLPTASRDVEVRLQNFLAEDTAAQFYPDPAPHHNVDEDFRWYYELLDGTNTSGPRRWVRARLRGRALPLPRRSGGGGGHGHGGGGGHGGNGAHDAILGITQNCMPAVFPAE